ncbi:MAG: prephenate dehydrogenase/arogenate dehydrogenase family protein [Planctomycetota bacterium]
MSTYSQVSIIGVGLIGGSIGLALRERGLAAEVVGVGRRQASLDRALECSTVDRVTLDFEEGVAAADIVLVATPVESVVGDVTRALTSAPSGALVTDAGSTKSKICEAVSASADDISRFVGSHPLAGDHRSGPGFARGDLFVDKTVVVTPTEITPAATTQRAHDFWRALGAHTVEMSPNQHDQALAATSHLPHLVASALASSTPAEWLPLAATGWSDTTRIAAADPSLWTQIFAQNTTDLVAALDRLLEKMQSARSNLLADNHEAVEQFLQQAKRTRDALGN